VIGSPLLERFLYGVRPHDAAGVIAVTAVLAAVTVLASALPARRAAGIAPHEALREG
jgi:ABC-type lipoprotein release transport system permease subunit